MEEIQTESCDFCGIARVSVLCFECSMSLCEECKINIHEKVRCASNHIFVPREIIKNLPKVNQICETHGEILKYFCKTHDLPICNLCRRSHSICPVIKIEHTVKDVKTSIKSEEIKSYSSNLLSNIRDVCAKMKDEILSIPDKKQQFNTDIDELKRNMEDNLHRLQQEGLNEISKHEGKIQALYYQLSMFKNNIEKSKEDMSSLIEFATDYQTFLGLYEIENNLRRNENSLQKVFEDNNVTTIKPTITFSFDKLKSMIFDIGYTGIEMPQMIHQPQIASPTDIYSIELKEIMKINLPKGAKDIQIRGCAITQNGELWFVDRDNHRVLFWNRRGNQCIERHLPCAPVDLTAVGEDKVVISLGSSNSIATFDIRTMTWTEQKCLESPGHFGGIAAIHEKLLVRIGGFGYCIINAAARISKKIEKPGQYMPYIATGNNTMYYAKWDVGKVYCCNLAGEEIWENFVGATLKPPNGVAVDESGNIYVTGSYSNNVVIISSDGKNCRELISNKEGLQNPIAIDYDKRSRQLLVSTASGIAVLYSVTRK